MLSCRSCANTFRHNVTGVLQIFERENEPTAMRQIITNNKINVFVLVKDHVDFAHVLHQVAAFHLNRDKSISSVRNQIGLIDAQMGTLRANPD